MQWRSHSRNCDGEAKERLSGLDTILHSTKHATHIHRATANATQNRRVCSEAEDDFHGRGVVLSQPRFTTMLPLTGFLLLAAAVQARISGTATHNGDQDIFDNLMTDTSTTLQGGAKQVPLIHLSHDWVTQPLTPVVREVGLGS